MKTSEYLFDLSTFDDEQLAALAVMKERYETEKTPDQKRLEFARYLVETGRISEMISDPTEAA